MTAPPGPAGPDPAPPKTGVPAGDLRDEEVEVRYLAGQRLPAAASWLKVTTAGPGPEGDFTAVFLPEDKPRGGDVLLHVFPAASDQQQAVPDAQVRAVTVAAGPLVLAAAQDRLDAGSRPGQVRPAAALARGELRDHGAGPGGPVRIAGPAVAGVAFPGSGHPVTP
jgi:hypothetical protein